MAISEARVDKKPFRTTRLTANLRAGRNDWYRIRNAAGTGPALIDIYDEIGYFGITAQDFITDLGTLKGRDVELHLNSPGGEIFDGIAIYERLSQHDGGVGIVIDSLAASAASVIAMAADPGQLEIARNGQMMLHDGFGMCVGNAADMTQMAALLDKASDNIASIYAERTGQPAAQWRDVMRAEKWYNAQESVEAGLVDKIRGRRDAAASNSWDLSVFRRAPGPQNSAVDESAWDASKAWAAGAASDDPAAFYNAICAGKKAGDPATQGAHALPHHYEPGRPPNRHGVSAGLGRIDSTDGLTNKDAARAHLEAHQSSYGGGSDSDSDASNSADFGFFIDALRGATA